MKGVVLLEDGTFEVTLTAAERIHATVEGLARQASAEARNAEDVVVSPDDPYQNGIDGAGAEMALAKVVNRYWGGAIGRGAPDVGTNIQVRSTVHANGRLIIRARDDGRYYYGLVRGTLPTYQVVGYIQGDEARRRAAEEKWLDNPRDLGACVMVPGEALTRFKVPASGGGN